jgi:hypothetical protein
MRSKADSIGRRSNTLFGDAPSFDELRKKDRYRIDQAYRVSMVGFWYWFRVSLPLTAPVLLVMFFLIPWLWFNATDGYIFFGAALSMLFSLLAVISYVHIPPWRRHPSSLMIQICFMSIIISAICMVNAYPTGKLSDLKDASDINLSGYGDQHDHHPSCMVMSFFIQLTLLAREMWILSLSLDLLTSITNPFASYTQNIRKYHTFIWLIGMMSASVLVLDNRCQGEFLNNGTCWIKVSGIHSVCFWGYFMSWIILFYINAMTILTYAYTRITKGLESTFATRFAFVADTFRVVFFYFFYGLFLAVIFIMLYYYDDHHPRSALALEHILAFFIAARGFFDALVWFFSHGFINNQDKHEELDSDNNDGKDEEDRMMTRREFSLYAATSMHNRRLFMKDVVTFHMIWSSFTDSWRSVCCCRSNKKNGSNRDQSETRDQDEIDYVEQDFDDEHDDDVEEAEFIDESAEDILAGGGGRKRMMKGKGDLEESRTALLKDEREEEDRYEHDEEQDLGEAEDIDLLLDTRRASSSGAPVGHKSRQSQRQISFKIDGKIIPDSESESSQNLGLSQSQSHTQSYSQSQSRSRGASSLRLTASGQRKSRASHFGNAKKPRSSLSQRSSDLDVSPQLNLALREEVLSLVTQGIKESVKRMMLRDQQQYTPSDVYAQSIYHPSSPPGRTGGGGDRFDLSQSTSSQMSNDEFERIRLSDVSDRASPHAAGKGGHGNVKGNGGTGGGGANVQSHSATKYRSILDFLSYSFYPANNTANGGAGTQVPATPANAAPTAQTTQESRSHRTISNALHGLLSAVGAYIPGEYGVDPIHAHLEQHSMGMYSSSYTSSQYPGGYAPHTTASYHYNPNFSQSVRPSVASSIYDDRGLPMMAPPGVGNFYPMGTGGGINPLRKVWGPPGTNSTANSGQEVCHARQFFLYNLSLMDFVQFSFSGSFET